MRFSHAVARIALCVLTACTASQEPDDTAQTSAEVVSAPKPPPNFVMVRPGLYRGGHPDGPALDFLKAKGVKRIVDLEVGDFIEAFPWTISQELDDAHKRGLTELRYPMSAFEPAVSGEFDEHMNQIVALLETATPSDAIYVHCKHGQDRTGLVIGLERVLDEGWKPADAYAEMVKLGFHTFFLGLDEYFERKTGFSH